MVSALRWLVSAACLLLLFSACEGRRLTAADELPALPVRYETEGVAAEAVARLSTGQPRAEVLTDAHTISKTVFLTFDGLANDQTTASILDLLDIYNIKASFFLPGLKSAEAPESVLAIRQRGHHVGSYTLQAARHMENLAIEQLAADFARTNGILSAITGDAPDMLKCRSTEYTEEVLLAAGAAGLRYMLDSRCNLNSLSFRSQQQAVDYVRGLDRGAILSVKVDSALDETEYSSPTKTVATEAKNDDALSLSLADVAQEDSALIQTVGYLLAALTQEQFDILAAADIPRWEDLGFSTDLYALRTDNGGALAEVFTNARTTLRGVGLAFRSLPDGERLDKLLAALKAQNISATFYVTGREIEYYPEHIEKLLEAGHMLENGGTSGNDLFQASFEQVVLEIYRCGKLLEQRYGVSSCLFMPPGGKITDTIREAANALGYTVASYNKNPAGADAAGAQSLLSYFATGLHRGDIIYADLKQFDRWEEFIPLLAEMVRDTGYNLTTTAQLYNSQYPLRELGSIPGANAIKLNPNFDAQIPADDKVIERIETRDRVVFLTFDDWGSDKTVTELLDTLQQHDVKAAFFVRASGAEHNPNLLRAIAEQGHDVFSHSYSHQVITTTGTEELQADAIKAHQVLTLALGKAPLLIYRPPTLEYDGRALNALLASGYKYLLGGNISTHDYERTPAEVARMVLNNAEPGSIIIMHMSDNACARAAVNLLVPQLRAKGYSFGMLSDYLERQMR